MARVIFSPSGELLAAGWDGPIVRRWAATNFSPLAHLEGYEAGIRDLRCSRDGELLAAWCIDGFVRVREMKSFRMLPPIQHLGSSWWMTFSPDGKLLAISSQGGTDLWYPRTGEKYGHVNGTSPTFTPDGQHLAMGKGNGLIQFWNVKERRFKNEVRWVGGFTHHISFSPDGRSMVTADSWITLRFWNLTMFREVLSFVTKGDAYTAFSPDGNTLAIFSIWRQNQLLHASSLAEAEAELAAEAALDGAYDEPE